MIWAFTDKRVIEKRIAKKVECATNNFGSMSAAGVQAVLQCAGVLLRNPQAVHNANPDLRYPFPVYFVETGNRAVVEPMPWWTYKTAELVN